MHGMIGVAQTALRNRRGRKRKARIKLAGRVVMPEAEVVDYRALAALQPHRVGLPERFRGDYRAGTVLGNLLLTGQLAPHESDGMPSGEALRLYSAGNRYAQVVGAYRAVITPPRGSVGPGRGYQCGGEEHCDVSGACECLRRTKAYNEAFECLSQEGRRMAKIVRLVAVNDEPCGREWLPVLRMGLKVLAGHFEEERG